MQKFKRLPSNSKRTKSPLKIKLLPKLISNKSWAREIALRNLPHFDGKTSKKKGDYDTTVVFTGDTGEGKTTEAIHLCKPYCRLMGIKWDFKKHMIYTARQFLEKTDTDKTNALPRFSPILVDEAHRILFNRNFGKKFQKKIIERVEEIRKGRNYLMIFCIPDFRSLDSQIRRSKLNYWGYVPKRGYCYVFKKDKNPLSTDKWHMREIEELGDWEKKARFKVHKISTFYGVLKFSELSKPEWEAYEEVAFEMRKLQEEEDEEKSKAMDFEDMKNAMMYQIKVLRANNLLARNWAISLSDLWEKTPRTLQTWVKDSINPFDKNNITSSEAQK